MQHVVVAIIAMLFATLMQFALGKLFVEAPPVQQTQEQTHGTE